MRNVLTFMGAALTSLVFSVQARAEDGYPSSWQLGLQSSASPLKTELSEFYDLLFWVIIAIAAFVLVLIAITCIKFRRSANPEPSQTTHHFWLEVLWTIVPVGILIFIAIPSFQLLFYQQRMPEIDMTIKVTGYQWYWGYEYPDHGDISFLSYMIPDEDIDESKGQRRLLETDNPVVLPVDTNIRIQITAADVLHSFTVPAFGIKKDAIPWRLNETWVRIDKEGTYYGQCSEICGTGHAYMPIMVKAVSKEKFEEWVEKAKEDFASANDVLDQPVSSEFAAIAQ